MATPLRGAILSLALLAACASLQRFSFEQPTAELRTIRVLSVDATGGQLELVVDIYNPNDYRLRASRLDARLDVEGTRLAEAEVDENIVIEPVGYTAIELPTRFTWEGVAATIGSFLEQDSVGYRLETRLRLQLPAGERRVFLRRSGRVPIRGN